MHQFANRAAIVTGGTGALGSTLSRFQLLASGAGGRHPIAPTRSGRSCTDARKNSSGNEQAANLFGARVDLTQTMEVDRFVRKLATGGGALISWPRSPGASPRAGPSRPTSKPGTSRFT